MITAKEINEGLKAEKSFFKDLEIGEQYHDGIYVNAQGVANVNIFEKVSGSQGKRLIRLHYSEGRVDESVDKVQGMYKVGAYRTIFKVEKQL